MSPKIVALIADIAALDEASAASPRVVNLEQARGGLRAALEGLDDEHAESIEALQTQIREAVRAHKTKRDQIGAEIARYDREIETEKKSDEPRQAVCADLAQELVKKYGKPLPELRALVETLS